MFTSYDYVFAANRLSVAARSPCQYETFGLNCLSRTDAESWAERLEEMRAVESTVLHIPCLPCEARLQLQAEPWLRKDNEWNGRAS